MDCIRCHCFSTIAVRHWHPLRRPHFWVCSPVYFDRNSNIRDDDGDVLAVMVECSCFVHSMFACLVWVDGDRWCLRLVSVRWNRICLRPATTWLDFCSLMHFWRRCGVVRMRDWMEFVCDRCSLVMRTPVSPGISQITRGNIIGKVLWIWWKHLHNSVSCNLILTETVHLGDGRPVKNPVLVNRFHNLRFCSEKWKLIFYWKELVAVKRDSLFWALKMSGCFSTPFSVYATTNRCWPVPISKGAVTVMSIPITIEGTLTKFHVFVHFTLDTHPNVCLYRRMHFSVSDLVFVG